MRVALLGAGRTGGHVARLHPDTSVFDSKRPPSPPLLRECDVAVCFLPGPAFADCVPALLSSGLPVVTGATGWEPDRGLDGDLRERGAAWIWGTNFSLGMRLVHGMLSALAGSLPLLGGRGRLGIHEVHHEGKRDAPSGTALSWRSWLGVPPGEVSMTWAREGDAVGAHRLTVSTGDETLEVSHEALDRAVFARGALWAAEGLARGSLGTGPGLHLFEDVARAHAAAAAPAAEKEGA